jgi:acetylornithine/succinyldiaminopimelate/putrescine aminotransferase
LNESWTQVSFPQRYAYCYSLSVTATKVKNECQARDLLVTQTQGIVIRIFPALNIRKNKLEEGLQIMEDVQL